MSTSKTVYVTCTLVYSVVKQMDFIVLRFVRRIASAWNVLIQVQNYRTLKISNIWQMVLASLKHNPFSELVRWKGIFLQASGETPIEIASGLAKAIFTCQTEETLLAKTRRLGQSSVKIFPKAVVTPLSSNSPRAFATSCSSSSSFWF